MKKEYPLEFCFKGSRTYVQGPDIFDTVVPYLTELFSDIKNIKYTAYDMLHSNATLYITDTFNKKDYTNINSVIIFFNNDTKYYAVVSQNNIPIECSVEYSEKTVEENAIINGNTITFQNTLKDSFSEIVVSMNKYFLSQTIDAEGKWIVTKFDYSSLTPLQDIENKTIQIELLQNLNNQLTKSALYLEKTHVGNLYFSLIPKES